MIVLAAVAWGGLGLSSGPGAVRGRSAVAAGTSVVDTTPPKNFALVGGPNADGWYNTAADYVWTAEDPESGIASCQGGVVEPVESSMPRTVYGTCTNGSGITGPYHAFIYRYDGTPPTLHPVVTRSVVTRFGIVVAKAEGTDALSGVARQVCNGNRALSTRRLGAHTVTCVVHDRAGNFATATVSYVVVDRRLLRD